MITRATRRLVGETRMPSTSMKALVSCVRSRLGASIRGGVWVLRCRDPNGSPQEVGSSVRANRL